MDLNRWRRVKEVFAGAQGRPESSRALFLREACGSDQVLRDEVESLLAAQSAAGRNLEPPSPGSPVAPAVGPAAGALVGRRIGPFTLRQLLGHGGMGMVYEAEQDRPRRRVALKIVRGGAIVDQHVVRLFHREVQALALLNHPTIASLYEAGNTEDGQHFFAMELVRGEPLTLYATTKNLSLNQRLELFARVCDGIAFAHQRGVIHRDIKPGNVLIDAAGQPKILDFGLARITDSDLALATMTTEAGKIQGTLAYMSPEQARGASHEIDLRSDIYSLGVVLYELLTGQLPYDVRTAPMPSAVRIICDQSPARPSAVRRGLSDDAETIVLRCLAKERERRYQSADALAADIRHYLAGEPIEAKRDSALYVLRMQMGRHRAAVAVACVLALLITGSSVLAWTLYARARRATANALRAQAESTEVATFLNDTLARAHPIEFRRSDVTMREVLDRASSKLNDSFHDRPHLEAKLRTTIGAAYNALARYDDGYQQLSRAVELRRASNPPQERELALCLTELSQAAKDGAKYDQAEKFSREALDIYRRIDGEASANVAGMLQQLGEVALAAQQWDKAEPLFQDALARRRGLMSAPNPEVAQSLHSLGLVAYGRQDFPLAETRLREALALRRETLGENHYDVAETLDLLGLVAMRQNDFDQGVLLLRQALAIRRAILGDAHPVVAANASNLSQSLRRTGQLAEAERFSRLACDSMRRAYGGTARVELSTALTTLAGILAAEEKYSEAETIYAEALAMRRKLFAPDRGEIGVSLNNLAALHLRKRNYSAAEPLYREADAIFRKSLGPKHPDRAAPLLGLATVYVKSDRAALAEPMFREVLMLLEKAPNDDWRRCEAQSALGACLTRLERYSEAEPLLLESYTRLTGPTARKDKPIEEPLARIVALYEAWGKPDDAARWKRKAPTATPASNPTSPAR